MTDTQSDTQEINKPVPTPDECRAQAAEALRSAQDCNDPHDAIGLTQVAEQWRALAHDLAEHGPTKPITMADVNTATLDTLTAMARQYPTAFAATVHALIGEFDAHCDQASARFLTLKAESERLIAEGAELRRRGEEHTEVIRTLTEDMTKLAEVGSSDADDAHRYRDDYQRACTQIADMHAAAFGGQVRGPNRGVVEDIEDLYARAQAAEEGLSNALRTNAVLREDYKKLYARCKDLEDVEEQAREYRHRALRAETQVQVLETGAHSLADVALTEARAQAPALIVAHYVRVAAHHLVAGHHGPWRDCPTCNVRATQDHPTGQPVPDAAYDVAEPPACEFCGWSAQTHAELIARIERAEAEAGKLREELHGRTSTVNLLDRKLSEARGELSRLATFLARQYPEVPAGTPPVSGVIDVLNTRACAIAALVNVARELIAHARKVPASPASGLHTAADTLAALLDMPAGAGLTPNTVTVGQGEAIVRGKRYRVPPVGTPITMAEASSIGGTPVVHVYDPEPARSLWEQTMRSRMGRPR